jgi:hypothetical protein
MICSRSESACRFRRTTRTAWATLGMPGFTKAISSALLRAFELNPRYEFAGNLLVDLHFEAGQYDQAGMLNSRVRAHSESPDAYASARPASFWLPEIKWLAQTLTCQFHFPSLYSRSKSQRSGKTRHPGRVRSGAFLGAGSPTQPGLCPPHRRSARARSDLPSLRK